MAISNTHSVASYGSLRLALFRQWEGHDQSLIFDTANLPTIGIGFNLTVTSIRDRVFGATGLAVTSDAHKAALTAILGDATILALPTGNNPGQRTYEMRKKLNDYLAANPSAANKTTFTLTDTEMNNIFNLEANDREGKISGIAAGSYEMLAVLSA